MQKSKNASQVRSKFAKKTSAKQNKILDDRKSAIYLTSEKYVVWTICFLIYREMMLN